MMYGWNWRFTVPTRSGNDFRAPGLRFRAVAALLLLLAVAAAPAVLTAQQSPPEPADPLQYPGRPAPVRRTPPQPASARTPIATRPAGQAAPAARPAADAQPAAATSDQKSANVTAIQNAPPVGGFSLQNANLLEVIDQLAKLAKINYVLDPSVKGGVTLNTYGETKGVDPLTMLQTILRINGYTMVQMGNIYRIVPLVDLARMPIRPESLEKDIPEDERPMLNLIFLKYSSVEDIGKLLEPFLGKDGKVWSYPNANLLLVLDSRRNIRRLMELVAMFDSDALAKQRVRVFDIVNSRPSELAKELEQVLQSVSLSKDASSVKFLPVDRINTLVAIAPNPVAFNVVEEWIKKLDIKVTKAAGKSDTYVYRVKYAQAAYLGMSIMQLYYSMSGLGGGMYGGMGGMGGMYGGMGGMYGGTGGMYGGMGGGMYGGGMSGYGGGMYGGGMSGYGGGMYGGGGAMYGSGSGYSGTAGVAGATTTAPAYPGSSATVGAMSGNLAGRSGMGADMTGNYLGMAGYGGLMPGSTQFGPRITPNISDNSLLILATPEQYESVEKLLHQLDVPPRQVLIEAQILEVTLTGQFSSGIQAWLQKVGATNPGSVPGSTSSAARALIGAFDGATTTLSAGTLVGQSRQLFGLLTAQEGSGRTKVVSTPRLIATDSIPAFINVGDTVPTLASQAVTGAQSSGSSLFANTIQNVSTGTTLNITARVNPSGVVTLLIDQEVSAPIAASSNGIQSPSFSQRTVKTQVTVEDGDMIAIGGIISETKTDSSSGIPFLYKIPFIGAAFGNKSITTNRTEMVIFLTPHVIYDTTGLAEASDDLVRGMKRVQKLVRE